MATYGRIHSQFDQVEQQVSITAAAGSAGQLLSYAGPSSSVIITPTSRTGFEYKIGTGAWNGGSATASITINADISKSRLYLRLANDGATSSSVAISISTIPVVQERVDFAGGAAPTRRVQCAGANFNGTTNSTSTGSGAKSWAAAFSAWGDFNAVQLVFLNHTTVDATIDSVIVGALASAWPGGTFNIAAPTGGWSTPVGPITVPAATGTTGAERAHKPGIALSPKIPVRSVARTPGDLDGGKYPLLTTRVLTVNGNNTACYDSLGNGWPALYDPLNEGLSILSANAQFVDYVTVNQTSWNTSVREAAPGIMVAGAIFTYDQAFTTVMGVGDSIMAGGADGAAQRTPYAFKASARLRAEGRNVSYMNGGVSGSKIDEIAARGKSYISMFKPDVMIIAPYTINSPVATQADWDTQWYHALDLAQAQTEAGRRVMFITPLPNSGFNATTNGYRRTQRDRVMASGFPYADLEFLVGTNGGFANAAHTTDGTHFSDSGHEATTGAVQPVLRTLISG